MYYPTSELESNVDCVDLELTKPQIKPYLEDMYDLLSQLHKMHMNCTLIKKTNDIYLLAKRYRNAVLFKKTLSKH